MEYSTNLHPEIDQLIYRFYKSVEIDTGETYAEWICNNTFLDGKPFSFRGYEYCIDIVNDSYPRIFTMKPAQVGLTVAITRKAIAILMKYGLTPFYYVDEKTGEELCRIGIRGICSFPNADDVRLFIKDRIMTELVNESPRLQEAIKEGESEAIALLSFHKSFLYSMGRGSEAKVQSIPAEIVLVDEFDQGRNLAIRDMLYARLKQAQIFKNKFYSGLYIGYGTPTLPEEDGYLISGKYKLSDQKKWLVKCTRCNHWQEVIYPDSIAYFYEKGTQRPDKEPYWMCLKCERDLDFTLIGNWNRNDPLKIHNAEWVAKYPQRTADGSGIRGYHIPFATLQNTAQRILAARDSDYKHSTKDFYNFSLGLPYRDSSIQLTPEDFTRNVVPDVKWGVYEEDQIYVMGIDQGCYMTIVRLKPDSRTRLNLSGVGQLVYAEFSKESNAFTSIKKQLDGTLEAEKGRIAELIDYWKPEVVVIDQQPNKASADSLALEYPELVWRCYSSGTLLDRIRVDQKDEDGNIVLSVKENRHLALESYFNAIKSHGWEYAKCDSEGESDVFKTFVKHHLAVQKAPDTDKITKDGINHGHMGVKYYTLGNQPDHYCQSGKLAAEALEIFSVLRPMTKIAGCLDISGFKIGDKKRSS